MFIAYALPENYATDRKAKVLEEETLVGALVELCKLKIREGYELLSAEKDGEDAGDVAFAKAGCIYLFTIEKE